MSPAMTWPEFRPTRSCNWMPSQSSTSSTASDRPRLGSQRGETGADSVVLQGDRRAEYGHDAVAGELINGAAKARHD